MLRTILAVVVGVITWWVLAFAGGFAIRVAWPAYAAVEQIMAFTLPMMAARLTLGAVVTLVAGALAARIAPASRYAALVLGTWRALVANLWVGLCGRTWAVPTHMILIALVGLQLLAEWAFSSSGVARSELFYEALPWILGCVIVLKFALAGWALRASHRRGQLRYDTAAKVVACWVVGAVGLFALLAWLVPSSVVPTERLAVVVVLSLPLTRLAVAPLALAWNRHR